jgi:hypothetical protein
MWGSRQLCPTYPEWQVATAYQRVWQYQKNTDHTVTVCDHHIVEIYRWPTSNHLYWTKIYGCAWEGKGPHTGEPGPVNQNVFLLQTELQFHQLSGWLVSDDPTGEEAGWVGPGPAWLHVVVRPGGRTAKFSKTTLEVAYGREINIQFSGISCGWHFCSQHANKPPFKTWHICGIVLCDKTTHFRVVFYCPQHKFHLCNDHAV